MRLPLYGSTLKSRDIANLSRSNNSNKTRDSKWEDDLKCLVTALIALKELSCAVDMKLEVRGKGGNVLGKFFLVAGGDGHC